MTSSTNGPMLVPSGNGDLNSYGYHFTAGKGLELNEKLLPDSAGIECSWNIFSDIEYDFGITRSSDGTVTLYLNGFQCAVGKPKNKEGFKIDPESLIFFKSSSSSTSTEADVKIGYGHGRGRLDSPQAWSTYGPYQPNAAWMQIDAGEETSIAGVITQGRADAYQLVTLYTVKSSKDGEQWFDVECGRIFSGNRDQNSRVINKFTEPVKARYIRIYVYGWVNHPSMRAGLLVCDSSIVNGKPSIWTLRIFKANSAPNYMPDVSTLTYVGQGTCPYVDFSAGDDFRKCVEGIPDKNFVSLIEGHVNIVKEGEYKFCSLSSDGSKLKVDGTDVVDNSAKHAPVEKCGTMTLKAGSHLVSIEFFQGDGEVKLVATYKGPDTGSQQILLPSDDFKMTVYKSDSDLTKMPEVSALKQLGVKVQVPDVDFENINDFKKYFPDAPDKNFAAQFWGKFKIDMKGRYQFCTSSSDGSKLWIDDKLVVDNGGSHGNRRYCTNVEMSEGSHTAYGEYFKKEGSLRMQITYQGPDTDDHAVNLRSDGAEAPALAPASQWMMRMFQSDSDLYKMPNVGVLKFLGSTQVPGIDFHSIDQLQRYFVDLKSTVNTATQWYGQLQIKTAGNYRFCTSSHDGSHLWLAGEKLIDNGGRHGNRQYCAWKYNLQAGLHPIKVDWFTSDNKMDVQAIYRGPDSDNDDVLIPSKAAKGPPIPKNSAWTMKVFVSNSMPTTFGMPDVSAMTPVADTQVPYIDFSNLNDFREVIARAMLMRDSNIVAIIDGHINVEKEGSYEFCVDSDDGTRFSLANSVLIDLPNGKKCVSITLAKGNYAAMVWWYNGGGYASLKLEWRWWARYRQSEGACPRQRLEDANVSLFRAPDQHADGNADIGEARIPSQDPRHRLCWHQRLPKSKHLTLVLKFVPGVPDNSFAMIFGGQLEIVLEGSYTFCLKSNDGSKLYLGGKTIVDNPSQRRVTEKCSVVDLKAGLQDIMIKYYDECCGEQLKATYAGPDTWQIQELIPSASPQKPKLPAQSKWTMRLYSAPWNLQSVPDLAWVQFLGQATCPNVDFDRVEELDQYIANVPREDMVGAWYGKIEIRQAGSYDFCLSSNDGSKMYYDDQLIVDNDGPHGERKKCATLGDVKAGKHKVSILWFTNDANYAIRATYKGPDTFGSESFLGSTEEWAPAMVKQSKWHAWIYEYKNKRNTVPDFDSDELKLKEEGIVPFINFKSSSEWRTVVLTFPRRLA
eukprot:768213-Hanusia_phi.AAC.4